jgi:hypothetical protein
MGRKKPKVEVEVKWNNTESRGWIKVRRAVQPRKVLGGGVSRYSRGSTREWRWGNGTFVTMLERDWGV